MRKKLAILRVCAALCVLALAASPALAEGDGGSLLNLTRSLRRLAFDTGNVTLTAEAEFSLDGEWFKTANLVLKQDGDRSFQELSLRTPKAGGTVYTGGYTVVAEGDRAYAMETRGGPFYTEYAIRPGSSLIRQSALNRAAADLLVEFSGLLGGGMEGAIVRLEEGGARAFRLSLHGEGIPAVLNAAFNLAVTAYAGENYAGYRTAAAAEYEDWNALFKLYYQKQTGKPMPKGFLDDANEGGADWDLYETVTRAMQEDYQAAMSQHASGLVLFRADGRTEWFPTRADYLRAEKIVFVYYQDADASFRAFYEEATGEPLPETTQEVIRYSANEELLAAFTAMWKEMDAHYKALAGADPQAVAVFVRSDGSHALMDTTDEMDGLTVTRKLLGTLAGIEARSVECDIALDEQENLLTAGGEASFAVTDDAGVTRMLALSFAVTASGYGDTSVAPFEPESYGVSSYDEYWSGLYDEGVDFAELPGAVTFDGEEYQSMVYVF